MEKARILIAEDDAITARHIEVTLKSLGYEVCATAASGEEAIEKAEELRPDLVLLDVRMQGKVDGIEAGGKIRACSGIPAIYLTALSDKSTVERTKSTDPFGYLIKPFDDNQLHATIEMALHKRKLEIEQHQAEEDLRKSRKSYQTLSENLPGLVYRVFIRENNRMEFFNDMLQPMTGMTKEELESGRVCSIEPMIIPADRDQVVDIVKKALIKKEPFEAEYRLQNKSGERKYFHERGRPVYGTDGKPLFIDGIILDITERKQAEKKAEHLNSILRAIRNVNQLITREKDRSLLIQGACNTITESRGYRSIWISLVEDSGEFKVSAESGLGSKFATIVEQLQRGELPPCGQKVMAQSGIITFDDPASECASCPLSANASSGGIMAVRLEHRDKVYGVMAVSVPLRFVDDVEEHSLFEELACDIALALHGIAQEEERSRAEANIENWKNRYEAAVLASGSLLYDWDSSTDAVVYGGSLESILGYTTEEMAGGLHHWVELIHPEDRPGFLEEIELLKTTRDTADLQYRVRRKSGEYIYISDNGRFFKDHQGRLVRMVGFIHDITERKQAEEALRESEGFLQSIIENIPNMIFIKDARELRFVRFNKAGEKLLGYSREELYGKNDYDFFPKKEADFFIEKDREVLRDKQLFDIPEEPIHTRDKGERVLHTKKIPILDREGNPKYLLGISEDITERRQAEEEIKASLREKEVLLKEIHHRVKNNLQTISSLLSLQADYIKDPALQNHFNESRDRVKSMALIHEKIYNTDDLSHIEFGPYLHSIVEYLYGSYGRKGVSYSVEADEVNLTIDTAIPCALIVNELVSNAFKHAFPDKKEGSIQIELRSGKEHKRTLTVQDDGIGFPPAVDFENTQSLGMQLVNSLAGQLDGVIELNRDKGTNFTITF